MSMGDYQAHRATIEKATTNNRKRPILGEYKYKSNSE